MKSKVNYLILTLLFLSIGIFHFFSQMTLFVFLLFVLSGAIIISLRWFSTNLLHFFIFLVFIVSVFTLNEYVINPPLKWVQNTDHHYLEHTGYEIDSDNFFLTGSSNSRKQFLDYQGEIYVTSNGNHFDWELTDAYIPTYTKKKGEKYFSLINSDFGIPFNKHIAIESVDSREPFRLVITLEPQEKTNKIASIIAWIKSVIIGNKPLAKTKYYISFTTWEQGVMTTVNDTSEFSKTINRGYSVYDIISECDSFKENNQLLKLISNTLMVKGVTKKPRLGNSIRAKDDEKLKDSPYFFFPSAGLRNCFRINYSSDLIKDTVVSYNNSKQIVKSFADKTNFYYGIGQANTTVYQLNSANESNGPRLLFKFPKKYPLVSQIDTICKVEQIISTKPQDLTKYKFYNPNAETNGGYLFNYQGSEENNYNINANLSYIIGKSNSKLNIEINDNNALPKLSNIELNNGSFDLQSDVSNIKWMFSVRNSKEDTPAQIWELFIILTMLLISSLFIFNSSLSTRNQKIEGVIFLVIYSFVFVRLILSYRITVFFPFDKLDYSTYLFIINDNNGWFLKFEMILGIFLFSWILINNRIVISQVTTWILENQTKTIAAITVITIILFLLSFVGIPYTVLFLIWIIVVMITLIINYQKQLKNKQEQLRNYIIALLVFILVFPLLNHFLEIFPDEHIFTRLLNIFVPLLSYFTLLAIIKPIRFVTITEGSGNVDVSSNLYAPIWAQKTFSRNVLNSIAKNSFFIQIGLALFTLTVLMVTDQGFALLFIFYLIINYVLHLKGLGSLILKIVLGICFFFIIKFQGNIIYWLTENFLTVGWGLTIVISIVSGIFLEFGRREQKHAKGNLIKQFKAKYLKWSGIGILSFAFVIAFVLIVFPNDVSELQDSGRFKSTKYRAGIMIKPFKELIENNEFESKDYQRIMRPVQNQWLIDHYCNINKRINLNKFKLQENTNVGASYILQTTDVLIPRYIIAEHGEYIIIILLLLLLLLIMMALKEFNTDMYIDIILSVFTLIFTTAFFVWLTSTNRLIFFGQDFPIISVTSSVAAYLYFILLLFTIVLLKITTRQSDATKSKDSFSPNTHQYGLITVIGIGLVIIGVSISGTFGSKRDIGNRYNFVEVLKDLKTEVVKINNLLTDYQKSFKQDATINTRVLEDFLKNEIRYDSTKSKFLNGALSSFINSNNKYKTDDILYFKKRNGRYKIVVNNRYFPSKPKLGKERWKGNLLAARSSGASGFLSVDYSSLMRNGIVPFGNIIVTHIPKSWTLNRKPVYIVRDVEYLFRKNNQRRSMFTVYKGDTIICSESFATAVPVFTSNKLEISYADDKKKYHSISYNEEAELSLSKNLWINGRRKLFYPLAQGLPWSVSFSNLIADFVEDSIRKVNQLADSVKMESHTKKDLLKISNLIVQTTIDFKLTKQLDSILKHYVFGVNEHSISDLRDFMLLDFAEQINQNKTNYFLEDNGNGKYLINGSDNDFIEIINNELLKEPLYNSSNAAKEQELILDKSIRNTIQGSFNFSVVGMDGNGKIRVMVDRSKLYRPDPNNTNEYFKHISMIDQFGSFSEDRDIVGNKNLLRVPTGVGSTFKPIVYSSVTSQLHIDWLSLYIDPVRSLGYFQGEKGLIKYYAGQTAKNTGNMFKIESYQYSDANGLSPLNYIHKSNNIYHSAIIFIGSFPTNKIRRNFYGNESSVLVPRYSNYFPNKESTSHLKFPYIKYRGREYAFTWDWPKLVIPNTPLALGLETMYSIRTNHPPRVSSLKKYYQVFDDSLSKVLFNYAVKTHNNQLYWSFPEKSSFVMAERNDSTQDLHNKLAKWLFNPSLGGSPINVTPLKMAEAGIRLYKFNNKIKASVLEKTNSLSIENESSIFYHNDWEGEELFNLYKEIIYKGMHKATYLGTANGLKNSLGLTRINRNRNKTNPTYELTNIQGDTYYLYVKTGTQGETRTKSIAKLRSKFLLVCITNIPIHKLGYSDIENNSDYKVYSLFITLQGIKKNRINQVIGGTWGGAAPKGIIQAVINSQTFNDYMLN